MFACLQGHGRQCALLPASDAQGDGVHVAVGEDVIVNRIRRGRVFESGDRPFVQRGDRVAWADSLEAAAEGSGTSGKTEGMSGELAPEMWGKGRREEVIRYCGQDAYATWELAHRTGGAGALRWVSRRGRTMRLELPDGWLDVQAAGRLELPDTGWMDDPIPREQFSGWLETR